MSLRAWPLEGQRPPRTRSSTSGAPAPSSVPLAMCRARHFADDFAEGLLGDAFQAAAKKNLAGPLRLGGGGGAMHQAGHRPGQRLVRGAAFGFAGVLGGQRGDFFPAEKGEIIQVTQHVAVVGADPELVEAIDAGFGGVHPDGAGGGLAEFGAVGVGDERHGQTPGLWPPVFLRMRSMPAVMLPHWSEPPICNSQSSSLRR